MTTFKSYSQYGEDKILKNILPDNGYFLEIGAYDPFLLSNTRFLVERGWSGCYVDGCSYSVSKFIDEYKNNDKINIVNCLISGEYTTAKLISFYSSLGDAVSSNNETHVLKWKQERKFRKIFSFISSFSVLDEILPKTVHFMNIDIEGESANLATKIDYDNYNTKVVCIEHDDKIDLIENCLQKFGFLKVFSNGTNIILRRD
jgi:hypothetical protein